MIKVTLPIDLIAMTSAELVALLANINSELDRRRDLARTADNAEKRAEKLTAQGYRIISRKNNTAKRIDREDWVQHMAKRMQRAPADFYVPGDPDPAAQWCDHYRRVYSEDKITLPPEVAYLIPPSGYDNVGYVRPL